MVQCLFYHLMGFVLQEYCSHNSQDVSSSAHLNLPTQEYGYRFAEELPQVEEKDWTDVKMIKKSNTIKISYLPAIF